ncbi:hypothetical protein HMPREF3034_01856 [Prevotella sp. DNF00663]|uniref:DciA family protein n=1 Tax=Prevotella sp. DNF00663 TaxID=1384078 RepID=UPI000780CB80|nr:DUF721 domain-containing protein [Prevotella sp. DNF00663]KXB81469.1 hypothetical protein HMPREF3034_01856 [Prevotella sp. DNF00663]
MFKRQVLTLDEVLNKVLRVEGLEIPLKQKRLIDSWPTVAGPTIARYTQSLFIKNQTLLVKISNPALRQDLSMMKGKLVTRLNEQVGGFIISDIKFY